MALISGLSGRLLVVTIVVVMLVEVVIFVPSVSRFRVAYLSERIERAHLATMTVEASPDGMISRELEQRLLSNAEVLNVVAHTDGRHSLMLSSAEVPEVSQTFDLRQMEVSSLILDAFARLATPARGDAIRVIGVPRFGLSGPIEITLDPAPLRAEMIDYGWRILRLSLVISIITAVAVFLVIRRLAVAPIADLIRNVRRFQENPEDPDRVIRPGRKADELGTALHAIAEMQETVRRALQERKRLASLGEALAKISHDLRNMLASLQLMVDRLEMSRDPMVGRVMPKIIGSLDRAIHLCQRTLNFGRAEEAEPELRQVHTRALAVEVAEGLALGPETHPVRAVIDIPDDHIVPADAEQLYRVLANLMRNASEAIQGSGRPGEIRVSAGKEGAEEVIRIADTGPGLPARTLENLFQPFRGGARQGGTGLGLAIARELVQAHGGTLALVSSTTAGTAFEVRLPGTALPISAGARETA